MATKAKPSSGVTSDAQLSVTAVTSTMKTDASKLHYAALHEGLAS